MSDQPPKFRNESIDGFIARRVCARCYGDLVPWPAPDHKWFAVCPRCEDIWHYATISRRTALLRAERAHAEYFEVRYSPAFRDLFPITRSEREIFADLGL
jgi:hypothetical protein